MSTLWTPSGEHPVDRERPEPAPSQDAKTGTTPPGEPHSTAEARRQSEELRRQLAQAPPEVVVANHCFGLFELAAVYLSLEEPRLDAARLAIDALGALVESLEGRLGEAEASLKDALAQIRLAFVQIGAAHAARGEGDGSVPTR